MYQHWIRNINKLTEGVVGFDVILMAPLYWRRRTRIRIPNPMATLYYAEHAHIADLDLDPDSLFLCRRGIRVRVRTRVHLRQCKWDIYVKVTTSRFFLRKKSAFAWRQCLKKSSVRMSNAYSEHILWNKLLVVSGIQCRYLPEKELCSWVAVFVFV